MHALLFLYSILPFFVFSLTLYPIIYCFEICLPFKANTPETLTTIFTTTVRAVLTMEHKKYKLKDRSELKLKLKKLKKKINTKEKQNRNEIFLAVFQRQQIAYK